jgi:transcriptional adapter 2-alpha
MLFCYICEKDVTNITHAVCDIAKVHVCLKCFASGKEKRDFKKGQPYRIIHNLNAELFSKGWSAHEELLLLEGLQTSGFGNWTDIAKLIGGKNREQCELHYLNVSWTFTASSGLKTLTNSRMRKSTLSKMQAQNRN